MAKKRTIPFQIRPLIIGYLSLLEKNGMPIEKAYLFGSWAKGKQHRWSDIDIAIVSKVFEKNYWKSHKLLSKETAKLEEFSILEAHGLGVKDFHKNSSSAMVQEIFKTGIRIM